MSGVPVVIGNAAPTRTDAEIMDVFGSGGNAGYWLDCVAVVWKLPPLSVNADPIYRRDGSPVLTKYPSTLLLEVGPAVETSMTGVIGAFVAAELAR